MNGFIVRVGFVVAIAILIGVYFVIRFRKHIRIIAAAALIALIAGAVGAAFWCSEAEIEYWLFSPYTTATQDNYLTMYCENTGCMATFSSPSRILIFRKKQACLTNCLVSEQSNSLLRWKQVNFKAGKHG
jgi:hypothetical protein